MTDEQRPLLHVVRGEPTEEELAAVVAVLAASAAQRQPTPPAQRPGQWRSRGRNVRPALGHGPGAWFASGLPR